MNNGFASNLIIYILLARKTQLIETILPNMDLNKVHEKRFADPSFEKLKHMPREWLAGKLARVYAKLKTDQYAAKARAESVEYIEDALEYAEDRDTETQNLFD